jgi:predicted outer membrane protein
MFSAFGVHAQSTGSTSTGSASGSGQDATTTTGKTTREGTAGNTNSRGKDERMGGASGTQGSTSSSGQATGMSGVQDTTGAGSSAGMTGKTTSEGTVGNTNSQGMEKRQGKQDSMSGSSGAAGATAAGKSTLSQADQKILMDMAQANINEVEAGKMAQSKSKNDQVKSFAQQMIDDHGKALTEVQQLAQQKGVTLPTEPDSKHKAMAAKMEAMSGDAFDKAYMKNAGVADHKAVHSALMKDEKHAKDPDVKALATKMAPVVEQHLKSAQSMPAVATGTKSGK